MGRSSQRFSSETNLERKPRSIGLIRVELENAGGDGGGSGYGGLRFNHVMCYVSVMSILCSCPPLMEITLRILESFLQASRSYLSKHIQVTDICCCFGHIKMFFLLFINPVRSTRVIGYVMMVIAFTTCCCVHC